jgi:hypothetical protein
MLIIPSPRVQQPQDLAGLDRHNPLTQGLAMIHNGLDARIIDSTAAPIQAGAPVLRPSQQGLSYDFAGAQGLRFATAVTGSSPSEATLFALVAADVAAAATSYTVIGQSTTSDNQLFRLLNHDQKWHMQFRGNAGSPFILKSDTVNITTGRWYVLAAVYRSGSGQKELWVDGVLKATSTVNIGAITLTQTEIGVLQRNSPLHYFDGVIPLSGIYTRALSAAEISALSANPWQMFEPAYDIWLIPATGGAVLTPGLFVNSNAFYAPTVTPGAVALAPSLFAESDTFYAPVVSLGGGTQALDPALFANSNNFYAPAVSGSYALSPALYADADTFYNATAAPGAVNVTPDIYTDADSFYSATAAAGAVTLAPDLYADSDSFYSAALTNGLTLSPALYADSDTFHAAAVTPGSVTLMPALHADSDTFYAPTVSGAAINLSPALVADADVFYGASIAVSSVLQPILVINANSFYVPAIGRGAVNLSPAAFINDPAFYTHSIGNGSDEHYPLAGLTQPYPLAGLTQQYPLAGLTQQYPLS